MAKLPAVSTLRKLSPSPAPSPGAINCEDLHFSHPITILSILSSGFLLKLFLLWGLEGEGFQLGGRGCHRSLLCFSFSTVWLQYHWEKKSFLCFGQHGPLTTTWALVTAWTTVLSVVSGDAGDTTDHWHQYGPQLQHTPQDTVRALGNSRGDEHVLSW